jgi:integrase
MTEKSFRFTKTAIDQLPNPTEVSAGSARYVIYWDSVVVGLGVVVRPSGTKTFVLSYRNQQRRSRRLTLGRYGRITLDKARQLAKQRNGEVASGNDPVANRRKDRLVKTLDQIFRVYIEEYLQKNSSEHAVRSAQRVRRMISNPLGIRFVNEISSADVRNCLKGFRTQRGNYNLIRTYVGAAWNWAQKYGFGGLDENTRNPVDGVETLPSTTRARTVTSGEYRAVFNTIDELLSEHRNDHARLLACLFVIVTGCRPIEAARLRREDISREAGTIKLIEHKTFKRTGEPKRFFLTLPVLGILDRAEALHKVRGSESDHIFPRRANQKASNWLAKTWDSVRNRSGVDIELRQFRSGYINLADELGMNDNEIAEVTQHASTQTIRRYYRKLNQKRARTNANRIGEHLQQIRRSSL